MFVNLGIIKKIIFLLKIILDILCNVNWFTYNLWRKIGNLIKKYYYKVNFIFDEKNKRKIINRDPIFIKKIIIYENKSFKFKLIFYKSYYIYIITICSFVFIIFFYIYEV